MQLLRNVTQLLLGAALTYAGTTHLTTSRQEFQAQVPNTSSKLGSVSCRLRCDRIRHRRNCTWLIANYSLEIPHSNRLDHCSVLHRNFPRQYLAICKRYRRVRPRQRSRPRDPLALSTALSYLGALVDRSMAKLSRNEN